MKTIQRVSLVGVVASALFAASDVEAVARYTYTSEVLEWESALLFGEPSEDYGRPVTPSFSFFVDVPNEWFSVSAPTTFFVPVANVAFNNQYFANANVEPGSGGTMTVNPDGSVLAWTFDMLITETEIPANVTPFDRRVNLLSGYGTGSCNCDFFHLKNTLYVERGHGYELLGPAEVTYRSASVLGNWTYAQVSAVPEPHVYTMMLGSLALMGWTAGRRRFAKPPLLPA